MTTTRRTRMPVAPRSPVIDEAVENVDVVLPNVLDGPVEVKREEYSEEVIETVTPFAANMEPPLTKTIKVRDTSPKAEDGMVAMIRNARMIIDDDTGKTPDPDLLFCQVTAYGTTKVCTTRVVEHVWLEGQNSPTIKLLIGEGARVNPEAAEAILAAIRRQIAAEKV